MSEDSSGLCGFDPHVRQLLFSHHKQTNVNVVTVNFVGIPSL